MTATSIPQTKRVTLTDIAKRAGVSHTTVSRALNGSTQVGAATRIRIQAIAGDLGYTPDPMMSALMKYRDRLIHRKSSARLAIISAPLMRSYWEHFKKHLEFSANRLGYDCEDYEWDSNISATRHSRILRSRGIRGLVLGSLTRDDSQEEPGLDWDPFASVTIGRFIKSPRLDSVGDNPFQAVKMALEMSKERGYLRIGLLTTKRVNEHSSDRLRAAFVSHMRQFEPKDRIPPLLLNEIEPYSKFEVVKEWVEHHKLDTIISQKYIIERIANSGRLIPDNLRFIALDLWKSQLQRNSFCGVYRDDELMARTAIATLHDHISHGRFGIPKTPKDILLFNGWSEGVSRIGDIR